MVAILTEFFISIFSRGHYELDLKKNNIFPKEIPIYNFIEKFHLHSLLIKHYLQPECDGEVPLSNINNILLSELEH